MRSTVLPGGTIGVFGSGQLGRMFAMAARRLGYRVHVLSPDDDTPAGQVADIEIKSDYLDYQRVTEFASQVDVVTFEFENVPAETADFAERYAPIRPAGRVLHTTQHRRREKQFLQTAGLPLAPWTVVRSEEDLPSALAAVGLPAVLKSASWGYDGKGQVRIHAPEDMEPAWRSLGGQEAIWEAWIDVAAEISVVAARGLHGEMACYPPLANDHQNHILDISSAPAEVPPRIISAATEIAREVMEKLDVVGVLCVEFFVSQLGELLVNELAPRPHNSGHLTLDAHVTSQFEQQVRSVCGLPLGSTEQLRPAAMVNLLGDLWAHGEPNWQRACELPDVKLHLYGKKSARPGRKMGHLTALGSSPAAARQRVVHARRRLTEWIST